jgi:hypothetical protein
VWERIVGGVGEQRLRHINDSVLSSLKMEGIRFFYLSEEASRNKVSVTSIYFKMSVLGINDVVCNTIPLVLFLYLIRPNSLIGLNKSIHKIPFFNTFLCD